MKRAIHIQITLDSPRFPTADDRAVRYRLEDAIEDSELGQVIAAGSGSGMMEIYIEVEEPEQARRSIWSCIEAQGLATIAQCTISA